MSPPSKSVSRQSLPSSRPSSRRGMQLKALLSLGLLAGFGAVSTLAAWTGGATATSMIGAGTVAIGVGASGGTAVVDYALPMPTTDWYPGRSEAVLVTVKNTGTLAAPYSVSGSVVESALGKLGAGMAVRVTIGTVTGASGSATCGGTTVIDKAAGAAFGAAAARPVLAAGGEQALCVQYSLPINAPTSLQRNSTTIKITFTATVGVS